MIIIDKSNKNIYYSKATEINERMVELFYCEKYYYSPLIKELKSIYNAIYYKNISSDLGIISVVSLIQGMSKKKQMEIIKFLNLEEVIKII